MMNRAKNPGADDKRGTGGSGKVQGSAATAFTLIELLAVIAIIGLLAAVGVGLSGVAAAKQRIAATQSGLNQLTTAIESYRSDFNQYPPDNNNGITNVNPGLNQLLYELVGSVSTDQGRYYRPVGQTNVLDANEIRRAFTVRGFLNAVTPPKEPRGYLPNLRAKDRQTVLITPGIAVDLLATPVEWPVTRRYKDDAGNLVDIRQYSPLSGLVSDERFLRVNPWRYVSTRPTNNPASYDLWAEVFVGGEKTPGERRTIGNWNQ